MIQIHINSFVRRQTVDSPFSHWTINDEELIKRIQDNFLNCERGYREGVVLVQIPADGFFSSLVKIEPDTVLIGEYAARQPGEDPRKSLYALGSKMPAKRVDVVLYHHSVLIEKNENESELDWEIVSVNASPTDEPTPLPVATLIANHLELSGGTATKMTDAEFMIALRQSVNFWADKANVLPERLIKKAYDLIKYKGEVI